MLPGSDSLGDPYAIAVTSTHLVVGDDKAWRPIMIFDKHTGEWAASVGARGNGPGEIEVWSFDLKGFTNSGWVYDFDARSVTRMEVDELVSTSLLSGREVRFLEGYPMISVARMGNEFVATGYFQSGRLAVYADDGTFLRLIGPSPPGPSDIPTPVRQHAYQAWVTVHPTLGKIAVASRHTDRLEIYEEDQLVHLVRGPDFFDPLYKLALVGDTQAPAMVPDPDMRFGYINVVSTDQHIYALYSGNTIPEVSHYASYGQQVLVFEWSGQPVARLDLGDGYAIEIAVSPDGQELFAAYDDPAPILVRYALPQFLKAVANE